MTEGSTYFPKACELSEDLTYTNVIELMLDSAISRIDNGLSLSSNIVDIPLVPSDADLIDIIPQNSSHLYNIM